MVTTVTERFFLTFMSHHKTKDCSWLSLRAANGLDIPYVGYVELDVVVLAQSIPKRGILIVKDPLDPAGQQRKVAVPGILGMNVLRECYSTLFEQHGPHLFQSPVISSAPPVMKRALRCCEQVEAVVNSTIAFKACVRRGLPILIAAGTMSMVPVTCPQLPLGEFLLEPLSSDETPLPSGLLVSPTLLQTSKGVLYAPVTNVGHVDVWLPSQRVVGTVQVVANTAEDDSPLTFSTDPVTSVCTALISVQQAEPSVQGLDLPSFEGLCEQEASEARALLVKVSTLIC